MSKFSVLYWASHPDEGNDDCLVGSDHDTEAEARAEYAAAPEADRAIAYVMLAVTGDPGERLDTGFAPEIKPNPRYRRPRVDFDEEWRSEAVMQAGMMGGVEAYNDELERWS